MQNLNVTIIQCELVWEDPGANLYFFDNCLNRLGPPVDLVVLPEMFTTGFSMNAQNLAQEMDGPAVKWIREKSAERNVDITGSLMIREAGHYYNRLVWAKPDRSLVTYDKKHLFRMSGEEKVYSQGNRVVTVDLKGWRIRPFICYDLRFPIWNRNTGNPYDLAVYVANWPSPRAMHWTSLLKARSIENQCYVIGVNRIGTDGNGHEYEGNSSIIDPAGNILFRQKDKQVIHTENLSHDALTTYRKAFPAWMDADHDLGLPGTDKI